MAAAKATEAAAEPAAEGKRGRRHRKARNTVLVTSYRKEDGGIPAKDLKAITNKSEAADPAIPEDQIGQSIKSAIQLATQFAQKLAFLL